MNNNDRDRPSFYDVHYGLASVAITNGTVIVASTAAAYHGFSILCTSAGAVVRVYDSISAATGNLLDIMKVGADISTRHDNFIPVQAKFGIVANVSIGTGAQGVVFFSPKG